MKNNFFDTINHHRFRALFQFLFLPLLLLVAVGCADKHPSNFSADSSDISVSLDPAAGGYSIHNGPAGWTFRGTVGDSLGHIETNSGQDSIGSYKSIRFRWTSDQPYRGAIRRYDDQPVVVFSLTSPQKAEHMGATFPSFSSFPDSLHHFSYQNTVFAHPKFGLTQTSTPWLFFNDHKQAVVLSPASDFMVSKMSGDGKQKIASGLNPQLKNLPAGFTHKTIMVFGDNIHDSWAQWGDAMRSMYNRKRPGNTSDTVLKYYGYWTDNGANYYYNYDKSKGYGGTLQALKKHYEQNNIPMGYMQLDSWWYEKSKYDPRGNPTAGHKNKAFPAKGKWNRYGGLLSFTADKYVFPQGLKHFNQQVDMPLVVHNRWIDPHSPYHDQYDITGYAGTGQDFWDHIASYIDSAGVQMYEQDWLNYIYSKTPQMASDLSVGNDFTDHMAAAMQVHGIDMQYCMAMPRYFMQGLKYNNLTTIRTSDDRFEPGKWREFLYSSQLAYSMGIWPWSDVFMSNETGNMVVSVLSAGAVGTGDLMGNEDKTNIMRAARSDGALVKPDQPLLPMDQDYLHEANDSDEPMLAATYTAQDNVRTSYVLAFAPTKLKHQGYSFSPSELHMNGKVAVYNPRSKSVTKIQADSVFSASLGEGTDTGDMQRTGNTWNKKYNYSYYIVAPITPVGVGFLGDAGKIAATGRQRISTLKSGDDELTVGVKFADEESTVHLRGYYENPIAADHGKLELHPSTHMFDLRVDAPQGDGHTTTVHITKK